MREKNPAAVELGRLGGLARIRNHTPKQIREQARKAAQTRWEGVKSKK